MYWYRLGIPSLFSTPSLTRSISACATAVLSYWNPLLAISLCTSPSPHAVENHPS